MRGRSKKNPRAPRLPGWRVKRKAPDLTTSPPAPRGGPCASGSGTASFPVVSLQSEVMPEDRESGGEGKRGELGGRRIIKKKNNIIDCIYFFKQKTAYEILA